VEVAARKVKDTGLEERGKVVESDMSEKLETKRYGPDRQQSALRSTGRR